MKPTAVRQVALAAGDNLGATLLFWSDVLGLTAHAVFPPQGIGFILINGVRLFFNSNSAPGTVYLDVADIDAACKAIAGRGVGISAPVIMHVDRIGQFGPPDEAEWMAFLQDPADNSIGLVERRPT